MAVQIDATMPRMLESGRTGKQSAEAFVSVRLQGAAEIAARLELMAIRANQNSDRILMKAAAEASRPIREGYKKKINKVTDNLFKSVATKPPKQMSKYRGVGVAITGPQVTGPVGANQETGSGNHAWLVEFGSGARRPGTQGRRTYINVHQMINNRMRPINGTSKPFNNEQFARMSKGHYFLMGSKNERTRQAKMGSGYPHDFGSDAPGEMHPITLQPGETIAPMPAQHTMERTIAETSGEVMSRLINTMSGYMDTLMAGGTV
jgi:hypothetical protein